MLVLGINAFHGDASAAILADGSLVAAVEEERFTRVKHTAGFPAHAVRFCLDTVGASLGEIDHVAIPRDPRARLGRKLLYALRLPKLALKRTRVLQRFIQVENHIARSVDADPAELRATIHRVEHHKAHLASSFFVAPFDQAALLSLDGFGDFASAMWGVGQGNSITTAGSVTFPHSLGLFYTALTQYIGFPKYGDEYKVMGLASYGEPEFMGAFRRLLRTEPRLGYKLDLRYFTHHREGADMTWESGEPVLSRLYSRRLTELLGPVRELGEEIESRHQNIAATLQARTEEVVVALMSRLSETTGLSSLAYAGGVAFNCVANGKATDQTPFHRIYIQPAAGDAGLAVGAAYHVWHQALGQPRRFIMDHAYWGPEANELKIRTLLEARGLSFNRLTPPKLASQVARLLADGKVVGWFQGKSEWGPRALGNRSILVDPRKPEMKDLLNRRVKNRETFRPFAPSILEERLDAWFEGSQPSPFMLMTYRVRPEKRALIPAPTHVDGTGRVQTVSRSTNPLFWNVIREFENLTGVPVLLNTSFNENEPLVNTPEEALNCFLRTRMDVLAIGPFVVVKN